MGRGRLYFTFITVLTFGAFLLLEHFASSKEFHREVACFKDVVRLNCGNHSFIAIHEAYFTGAQEENLTCTFPALEHEYIEDESATEAGNLSGCYEDIRVYVNRKCSGLNECRFSYEDEPEKICP
uniref:U2-Deinotoxin-Dsu1a_1 n=1 Tax=Deinopis subrufa TaxID=1905329 RepID=A0A4Q8K245_DEISU